MKPPLTEKQINYFDVMADSRFNGEFWGCVNVRWVIKKLVEHIKYLEGEKVGGCESEKDGK